jgi:hypothetical protein
VPIPSTSDDLTSDDLTSGDLQQRAVLLLLLLAREAELPLEQVDSARSRLTVVRGLLRSAARRHRTTSGDGTGRTWMCNRRWSAA